MFRVDKESPISALPRDILYHIFSINANDHVYQRCYYKYEDGYSPLTMTRRSSQVCTCWREIILESPSIWGSCFELDMLAQKSSDWRDEVLRRTRSAALCIRIDSRNTIFEPRSELHTLLEDLLHDHWERIRALDIAVETPEVMQTRKIVEALGRPAPNLKEFVIHSDSARASEKAPFPAGFCLFSNDAPLLTRFALHGASQIFPIGKRDILSSTRLRVVDLRQQMKISAADLLAICAQLPVLEDLSISFKRLLPNDLETSSSVSLPKLEKLNVISPTLDIYPAFLHNITLDPACDICIEGVLESANNDGTIPSNVQEMQLYILERLNSAFDFYEDEVTSLTLNIGADLFHIGVFVGQNVAVAEFTTKSPPYEKIPDNILVYMLNAVSSLKFPDSVARLRLGLFDSSEFRRHSIELDDHHPLSFPLLQISKSLESVVHLHISSQSLPHFAKFADSQPSILFPSLKVLHPTSKHAAEDLLPLVPFIARRQATHPLWSINLHKCMCPFGDLRFLCQFKGLKVVYGVWQHVCGRDDQDQLLMDEESRRIDIKYYI